MLVIDARRIRDPQDADQALAVSIYYAEPGDEVPRQSGMCLSNVGGMCTGTPRLLKVGEHSA